MKKCILLSSIILSFFVSCNNKDDDNNAIDLFHEEYYDVNIKPALTNFITELESQIESVETFKTNTSEVNFSNLQEQWLSTAKVFSKTRAYNLVGVQARFFDVIIYNYPVKEDLIENNINEKAIYNTAYFTSKSTVEKGIATLEYLLYNNQDPETALELLQNDTYRIDYMLAVSKQLLRISNLLIDFWELEYKTEFINAKNSISCADNARCLAFNQLINILDIIRVTKLGKPSGLENSSNVYVESLEAYRSKSSLELMRSSIEEVEHAYRLSTVNFSSIVDEISGNSQISDEIMRIFSNIYSKMDAIDSSLYSAIENDASNVEELYDALLDLVQYFSVDAASTLSVTVLPTDNDGD